MVYLFARMPRLPKNPDHPLTRLRKILSTPTFTVTRRHFAEHYGFSLDSVTAIERGIYRLGMPMARRIQESTGVSAGSLILGEDPLRAWDGSTFTAETRPPKGTLDEAGRKNLVILITKALSASESAKYNEDRSAEFYVMFLQWLETAMRDIRAEESFWKRLFESWLELEPDDTMRHLLFPTLMEGGEERKPTQIRRADAFLTAYQDRVNRIEAQRIEILVEQLESEPRRKELRSYLSWRSFKKGPTQYLDPKKVERALELERTALDRFAESKNIPRDAEHGWCDAELEVEAMIRLAVEDDQVAADDPSLPARRREWVARWRSHYADKDTKD
jgi:hypothetical protein